MKFIDFILNNSSTIIPILVSVVIILILLITLIVLLIKHGKVLHLDLFYNKKSKNKESENVKEGKVDNVYRTLHSHKFFSSVKYDFVEKDYGFKFNLYDTLLEHGIKEEDDLLVGFKKVIANEFLSNCLFKYINDSTEDWINSVLDEVSSSTFDDNSIPLSLCDIIENLVHFTKETTRMASSLKFTYCNKIIDGIPNEFVKCFCNTVNNNIETIQKLFSSIIYTTNNSWYNKMIEILDIYELGLIYIKNSVDSTLVIMNGQMKKYVDEMFKNRLNI